MEDLTDMEEDGDHEMGNEAKTLKEIRRKSNRKVHQKKEERDMQCIYIRMKKRVPSMEEDVDSQMDESYLTNTTNNSRRRSVSSHNRVPSPMATDNRATSPMAKN